jgi:sugar phosphate isomerase/epimerase
MEGPGVARQRAFGVSTHLYHSQRLGREHLIEIGRHGFEKVELFATRSHVDYHAVEAIADLQQWLSEAQLELHSVHAPVAERFEGGRLCSPLNLASPDDQVRGRAVAEAERALHIGRRIPFAVLVAHLGVPRAAVVAGDPAAMNHRDAARRSIETLAQAAEPLGVRIAVEVIPNELSRAGPIVHFVEQVLADPRVGICLDFGHAHLDGDLVDAVETVSEHLIAGHLHDNRRRTDDHLVPFEGTIDWPAALATLQKVGYDGPLMLEIRPQGSTRETLQRARGARARMEQLLAG